MVPLARSPARSVVLRRRRALLLLVGVLASCEPPESGRVVECVAPAAAGGGWDLTCRVTTRLLDQLELVPGAVRTVNLPGAGGGVAFAHAVARRKGDPGVLFAASPATTLRLAQGQYGPLTASDVRWVGALGAEYGIVAVAADAPWADLRALLEAWRARPEGLVVSGGSAVAGQDHTKILLLAREAGIDPRAVRYVPFDGGGEALTALLGGFVQVFSGEASEVESYLETGSVRILAVLAPEPLGGILEGVPTARSQGYPVEWVTWRGFYLPPGLPDDVYETWVRRLEAVAASPEWEAARERARLRPFFLAGRPFESFVLEQVDTFRALARDLGLVEIP